MIKNFITMELKLLIGVFALILVHAAKVTPLIGPVGHFGFMTDFIFLILLVVIIYAATGVVHHAEALAKTFGEPYGTLLLTLTAVIVEVIMLATIMLHGPTTEPNMARDTMYSTVMILLSGLMGLALFMGGRRYVEQMFNYKSSSSFMTTLIALAALGFYLPMALSATEMARYEIFLIVNSIAVYMFFLKSQTGKLSYYFAYDDHPKVKSVEEGALSPEKGHSKSSVLYHIIFLILTVLTIALLVEYLSVALDDSLTHYGLPKPIAALFIAIIIITPEGLTAVRAALNNEMQRAINIAMGSALSTVALTIPAMLILGSVAGMDIKLALTPTQGIFLGATIFVATINAFSGETNELKGIIHFSLFIGFILSLFL